MAFIEETQNITKPPPDPAGGFFAPEEYGFGYIKALAESYYGIKNVRHIKALGLDIVGADVEKILTDAENEIMDMDI